MACSFTQFNSLTVLAAQNGSGVMADLIGRFRRISFQLINQGFATPSRAYHRYNPMKEPPVRPMRFGFTMGR
jgi:hypothetical protein